MIGDHAQLSFQTFERLAPELIAPFAGASTCQLVDALGGDGALDAGIKPLVLGPSVMVGSALTVECHPGDMFGVLAAMPHVGPGDVLVVASGGSQQIALTGDLIALALKGKGAAGFVTDGYVRDIAGLRGCGLPIFATGLVPRSATKTGPGKVGGVVVCGGAMVCSGDLVVADEDGVVVVPRARIQDALNNLPAIIAAEQRAAQAIAVDAGFFDKFATTTHGKDEGR